MSQRGHFAGWSSLKFKIHNVSITVKSLNNLNNGLLGVALPKVPLSPPKVPFSLSIKSVLFPTVLNPLAFNSFFNSAT